MYKVFDFPKAFLKDDKLFVQIGGLLSLVLLKVFISCRVFELLSA